MIWRRGAALEDARAPLPPTSIGEHFATLRAPRSERGKGHLLVDILTIPPCAVICGADDRVAVATFGAAKEAWLRTFPALPNGIPAHDTFGRVSRLLDPEERRGCFPGRVRAVVGASAVDGAPPGAGRPVVAVDGKTLRRSHDRAAGQGPLHPVSARAAERGPVVGQVATDAESNEIAAIPVLPKLLALEGATVTIDAPGCRTAIARPVIEQGAAYVLALEDNREHRHERVRLAFLDADAAVGTALPLADVAPHTTVAKGHGRLERRRGRAIDDPAYLAYSDPDRAWPGLQSLVCIESTRRIGDAVSTGARHDLSSLPADAPLLRRVVRSHWGIENRLPRVPDPAVHGDSARVRADHAPESRAIIRPLALTLPRGDPTRRVGLTNARFKAALSDTYFRSIVLGVRTGPFMQSPWTTTFVSRWSASTRIYYFKRPRES